jgi:hypothetical protein
MRSVNVTKDKWKLSTDITCISLPAPAAAMFLNNSVYVFNYFLTTMPAQHGTHGTQETSNKSRKCKDGQPDL